MLNFSDIKGAIGEWLPFLNNNSVNINTGAGDVAQDTRIFMKGATPGHQLQRITELLNALLDVEVIRAHMQQDDTARLAREKFFEMQAEVALAKAGCDPSKFVRDPSIYLEMVRTLHCEDPEAYDNVRKALRTWLDEPPRAPSVNGKAKRAPVP